MSLRRFTDSDVTTAEHALQFWQILIALAANRQTITYRLLAERTGMVTPAGQAMTLTVPRVLGRIMTYCATHDLPPLTVLVVNQETGKPGQGLSTTIDHDADRERVYGYPWYLLVPPVVDELGLTQHQGSPPAAGNS